MGLRENNLCRLRKIFLRSPIGRLAREGSPERAMYHIQYPIVSMPPLAISSPERCPVCVGDGLPKPASLPQQNFNALPKPASLPSITFLPLTAREKKARTCRRILLPSLHYKSAYFSKSRLFLRKLRTEDIPQRPGEAYGRISAADNACHQRKRKFLN